MSLFGIGVSVLAAAFLIGHTNAPQSLPAPPAMRTLSWQWIPTRQWLTTGGVITLRFSPDEIGPPTLHTVVDAGADAREIWYLPWIHDEQDPDVQPLPDTYAISLADALVYFGSQVDVIGKEGEYWLWDIRNENVSPHAYEIIGPEGVDLVRSVYDEEEIELAMATEAVRSFHETQWAARRVERAMRVLLAYTTTPVIGVEDPDLMAQETGAENPTRDRKRSGIAVLVLLAALRAQGGHRALLEFGMGHYSEIEEAVRWFGDVTLRVACIPALCEIEKHDQ